MAFRCWKIQRKKIAGPAVMAAMIAATTVLSLRLTSCTAFIVPSAVGGQWVSATSSLSNDLVCRGSCATTHLYMGLLDDAFKSLLPPKASSSTLDDRDGRTLQILEEVGSGSYGTVHLARLSTDNSKSGSSPASTEDVIAKRAWTEAELQSRADQVQKDFLRKDDERFRELAGRCKYYLSVEAHCLAKLAVTAPDANGKKKYTPKLIGVHPDNQGMDWLVFDIVGRDRENVISDGSLGTIIPAKTLSDILECDWIDQHEQDEADPNANHHLYMLQKELEMEDGSTFADVLDVTVIELLKAISSVNKANIVHRDIKPGNVLVSSGGFVLIDFGSAADLDPPGRVSASAAFSSLIGGGGGRVGLEDDGRVALSPIYSAPESFVRVDRAPLNFDAFSAALVITQLLFNLLDERAEASFRQQMEDVDFNLDLWLQRELKAELQPGGIEGAVLYLAERPGLWAVLRGMLHPDPELRLSAVEALERVESIFGRETDGEEDGEFWAGVLERFELCGLPDIGSVIGVPLEEGKPAEGNADPEMPLAEQSLVIPRPLHYVASFSRSQSLGLLLSEVNADGEYDDDLSEEDAKLWEKATAAWRPGEVYIRGIAEGGQAENMGIFEVGDRIVGVGDFPFIADGFNAVVECLQRQPPLAKIVTLHFDRKSTGRSHSYELTAPHRAKVVGQGAWSARGRRKTQEDSFVLQEIQDGNNAALLAGVFDGHGGDAASRSLAQLLPSLFSAELAGILTDGKGRATSADLRSAMESAFEIACRTYREGCDELESCVADYDPREGIILAAMGAKDVIAGSTATASVISIAEEGAGELTVLNCGDSRTLVVGRPRGGLSKDSVVQFSTRDHSPSCEIEIERLLRGGDRGYSQPKCSMGRWRIKVGDFNYGLARSLEGSFTTSKGIVSDPDVSVIKLSEILAQHELACIILASDGLFEVIDNEEAGRDAIKCRDEGLPASLAAKQLCLKALEKGSPDNVSVVILYLD